MRRLILKKTFAAEREGFSYGFSPISSTFQTHVLDLRSEFFESSSSPLYIATFRKVHFRYRPFSLGIHNGSLLSLPSKLTSWVSGGISPHPRPVTHPHSTLFDVIITAIASDCMKIPRRHPHHDEIFVSSSFIRRFLFLKTSSLSCF